MTAVDVTIHQALLPHDDPDASLTFVQESIEQPYGIRDCAF